MNLYISLILLWVSGFIIGVSILYISDEPKQPTVKCTDGKLYDVSYEGNITIINERPLTTCEETK